MSLKWLFQSNVEQWSFDCFGVRVSPLKLIRADRVLEEHLEMLQAADYPKKRILELVEYTYSRPKGELSKEVGGAMVTLAAFCSSHDIDLVESAEEELTRISSPEMIAKINQKQANKMELIPDSPLPQVVNEIGSLQVTPELIAEVTMKAKISLENQIQAGNFPQDIMWYSITAHIIQETINKCKEYQ